MIKATVEMMEAAMERADPLGFGLEFTEEIRAIIDAALAALTGQEMWAVMQNVQIIEIYTGAESRMEAMMYHLPDIPTGELESKFAYLDLECVPVLVIPREPK